MFAPSVAMYAVVGSDAALWCCTSHGSATVAASFHAAGSALGSSGGGACAVGIARVADVAGVAVSASARPDTTSTAAVKTTALRTNACQRVELTARCPRFTGSLNELRTRPRHSTTECGRPSRRRGEVRVHEVGDEHVAWFVRDREGELARDDDALRRDAAGPEHPHVAGLQRRRVAVVGVHEVVDAQLRGIARGGRLAVRETVRTG